MITTRFSSLPFMFALVAAATGCAAELPGSVDDDDDGETGGGGGGGDEPVPTSPAGTFKVKSQYDLATNMPGTAGTVVNYFIAATDDPDDPTKFLVDKLIESLPDGSIKNNARDAAPYITGYLNDRLLAIAPDFVGKLVEVGDAFGQATKGFGTVDILAVDASGTTKKTVTGLYFKIDNVELEYAFSEFAIPDIEITGLTTTLEPTGKLSISEHQLGLQYGKLLRVALDQAVIPMIDPASQNLGDVLKSLVNCQAVGQYVYEAVDFGSASTFESACNAGLGAAATALYRQMDNLDGNALQLTLAGTARGIDKNGDGSMDDITAGTYTGSTAYAGSPAPLGTNRFFGKKM